MCKVLEVSPSGFYSWVNRSKTKREKYQEILLTIIVEVYNDSYGEYGAPRITEELNERGYVCCENTVAKLMKANNICAKPRKKFVHTTDSNHGFKVFPNVINRDFSAEKPNQKWVSDITYVWAAGKWHYLCAIIDLYSRMVISWTFKDHMRSEMVIEAFEKAVKKRNPKPGLIFHSDRGIQYACNEFRETLEKYGVTQSMSRKGNCWDNSPAESFFGTIKTARINKVFYETYEDAKLDIFEYIEGFYNTRRKHSSIGYLSPMKYEEKKVG